jgi:hypothetical protein
MSQKLMRVLNSRLSLNSTRKFQIFLQNTNKKLSKSSNSKKATKPDRGERKKELNRVAATRYREKKRKEREEIGGVMMELEQRNKALKADIAAVQAEMAYLKGLAKEIEAARLRTAAR